MDPAVIQLGDHVIVYSSRDQVDSIMVKEGAQLQNKYGHYKHDSMVGVSYGTKFPSANGRGFVYLLRPTPELWTLALPHRTQILYLPDISFITSYLDIKPGSKVIEAGTGSGSFSHSIARSVGSKGKVHSFEFHEERYQKARDDFKLHELDEVIQLKHQNVYKDGFELVDEVDSVFLDLPAPWEALGHAKAALRKDRQSRICCFSPCIEQVLRTVTALSELGFSDITMYEALTRSHEPAVLLAPNISTALDRIHEVEAKKERRREGQIEGARVKREEKEKKRKREEEEGVGEDGEPAAKRVDLGEKAEGTEGEGDTSMSDGEALANPLVASTTTPAATTPHPLATSTLPSPLPSTSTARPPNPNHHTLKRFTFKAGPQSRGHTSYLTFATLLPGVSHSFAPSINIKAEDTAELPASEDNDIARSLAMAVAEEEDDFPISQEELEAISQLGAALDGNS